MKYAQFLKTSHNCPFCGKINTKIIFANKTAYITYAEAPYVKGHLLVCTKRHVENFTDITKKEHRDIDALQKVALALLHADGYKNASFLVRDGKKAGKTIDHLHYHIIPALLDSHIDTRSDRAMLSHQESSALVWHFRTMAHKLYGKPRIKKPTILLVCSGNCFRSFVAEKILELHLGKDRKRWNIQSAGTEVTHQVKNSRVISRALKELGVLNTYHRQKRATYRRLLHADLIIAMAQNHIDHIEKMGFPKPILFNELAGKSSASIWDIADVVPDFKKNKTGAEKYIQSTIKYFDSQMPIVIQKINEYFPKR